MRLILRRVAHRPDGMAGVLLINSPFGDLPLCLTLEDPWRGNRVGESCIPAGTYLCRRGVSPKFGETYEALDVPGRSNILFHWGNTQLDTRGCVLVGLSFDATMDDKLDVQQSRVAFNALMGAIEEDEFELVIEDCWGGGTAL